MRNPTFFVLTAAIAIAACSGCQDTPTATVNDAEWELQAEQAQRQLDLADEHITRIEEQMERYEKQLTRAEKMYDKAETHAIRLDKILDRWEKQADRYDKILDHWEKQRPAKQ